VGRAQTQRSHEHFNIGQDLIPREMIAAYATPKKGAANANYAGKRLDDQHHGLIVKVCDEILAGKHHYMFPLHVWTTGSGTQFNMNVNEVISSRCCQLAGTQLGSKTPVHPNDHVNMSQSSNDSFPTAGDTDCGTLEQYQRHITIESIMGNAHSPQSSHAAHANFCGEGEATSTG
jgi:fumarate hydratase class II